jgi:molybdopterin-binding protein
MRGKLARRHVSHRQARRLLNNGPIFRLVSDRARQIGITGNVMRKREGSMEISARNQLNGTVQSIKTGAVMAEIVVNVDAGTVAAVITDSSREHLNLAEGDQVQVVIKATEVMIAK